MKFGIELEKVLELLMSVTGQDRYFKSQLFLMQIHVIILIQKAPVVKAAHIARNIPCPGGWQACLGVFDKCSALQFHWQWLTVKIINHYILLLLLLML